METLGTIVNGKLVLDDGGVLPDGCRVRIEVAEENTPLGKRLLRFAGLAEGLPSDFADNHDHYLHGLPKRS